MQSIHIQIKEQIKRKRKGNIIFANDFKELGSGDAIRQILSRLCKEKFITIRQIARKNKIIE